MAQEQVDTGSLNKNSLHTQVIEGKTIIKRRVFNMEELNEINNISDDELDKMVDELENMDDDDLEYMGDEDADDEELDDEELSDDELSEDDLTDEEKMDEYL